MPIAMFGVTIFVKFFSLFGCGWWASPRFLLLHQDLLVAHDVEAFLHLPEALTGHIIYHVVGGGLSLDVADAVYQVFNAAVGVQGD